MAASLFDASLVDGTLCEAPFVVRPLRRDDFAKGFVSVLAQLTQTGDVTAAMFERRFDAMLRANAVLGTYYVVVVEDTTRRAIVGTATLLVEQKFIRGAALAGHVEDVVTDKSVRGAGIGRVLNEALLRLARKIGCYKVILDCADNNVPFYEKFGYAPKERQMAVYLPPAAKL
jgi:glucosamine-phosphate N-acetyltransferase